MQFELNDLDDWTTLIRLGVRLDALGVGRVESLLLAAVTSSRPRVLIDLSGVDFAKLSRVPVGVSLAYRNQAGSGKTGNISGGYRSGEFGLFYTGRSEFIIGGDFFWSRIAVESAGVPDLDAVQFRLVTRIDF